MAALPRSSIRDADQTRAQILPHVTLVRMDLNCAWLLAGRRLRPRLEAVAWRSFSASFVSLTPLLIMAER